MNEDRRRQRVPSWVSRLRSSLAIPMGTDVCGLCEPCPLAREGRGPGQGTRALASTVLDYCPVWVPPAKIHTRGMSSGRSKDPELSRPVRSSYEKHCACSKRAPVSCSKLAPGGSSQRRVFLGEPMAHLGTRNMLKALGVLGMGPGYLVTLIDRLHLVRSHEAPTGNSTFLGLRPQTEFARPLSPPPLMSLVVHWPLPLSLFSSVSSDLMPGAQQFWRLTLTYTSSLNLSPPWWH